MFLDHISPKIQVNKEILSKNEFQSATLRIFYQGSLVQIRSQKNIILENNHAPGRRGKATFSNPSRRRLMQKLATVNKEKLPLFITLTYPKEFDTEPKKWKRDLDNFTKNFKYHYPDIGYFWKLEPQKRGAPHYHIMVWGLKSNKKLRDFISSTWFRIVGSGDELHLKAGTQVKTVDNWDGVRAYASKYLGKIQLFAVEHVGRYWGIRYPENIEWSEVYDWKIQVYEAVNFSRIFKNYKKSVYREKAQILEKKKRGKTKEEKSKLNKIIKSLYKIAHGQKSRSNDSILVKSGDFWLSATGSIRKITGRWNKMSYVAQKIRYLRRSHKQNQSELAQKLNISQGLLAQWETEKSLPNLMYLEKICKVYNLTLSEFFREYEGGFINNELDYLRIH